MWHLIELVYDMAQYREVVWGTVSYSELLLCVCTSLRVGLVGQAVGLWATEQVLGKFLYLRGPSEGQ